MYLQCLKCRYCYDSVPDDQLRFLSVGKVGAPILIIDSNPVNLAIPETVSKVIDVDFGIDVVPQSIAGIGMFLLANQHPAYVKKILNLEPDTSLLDITWAVRCESGEFSEEMAISCSMYTRFLSAGRKIIITDKIGYGQLDLNLPDFIEGKLYKTPIAILLTVNQVSNWTPEMIDRYKILLSRAKKEVGL